ncbi:beta-lactamase class C [Amycolatopsis mediterranei S699]|uniref:Beta-lactamase class C n=2 Tax=Amycolatopsis mediterranei TaxID=33910 RepID=A0A0H3D377_AMYMU|nr:serine hydrolase domain-containing protein [Amycolatopsis mediterranei]ADJ44661.1 beta-lactamase class C [Amycolatopsis mediterranei U32]AEK41403.1 beta-lactamase class C [Amycolatopsis mediterranei S699]AFO76374.1 beta-lactamase class C [Amycolatopsis mediterranei S699]AGT83503.1 beta-lactamase class C [Amycolatopsis mediterranei RB]KDO06979.1 beta-lactamase [Amycolatopsis mediterranei]
MDGATTTVHGECAPGFEPVREAFEENFRSRGELGAAFTAIRHGEVVVDLWGGWSGPERARPWQPDTLANVWSTTKGMTALCAHKLADAGELDVDAPVAKYWPEFAAAGKAEIPVRWLLSHRSGVPGIGADRPVRVEELYDWELMTSLYAAQEPLYEPGSAGGYHALAYGWLVGEVVQRIAGQGIREFFAEQVAGPLGADFSIGLPADADLDRCATLVDPVMTEEMANALATAFAAAGPVAQAALMNPLVQGHNANEPAWRHAVMPALNGHGTARAIATIYGGLADGTLLSPAGLARARESQGKEIDAVLGLPNEWGLGFYLGSDAHGFGPNPTAFGHDGLGGSTGAADPENGIAFGYTLNQLGPLIRDDPRKMALVQALYESLPTT